MKTKLRYSICEPLNPNIIEKGNINKKEVIKIFEAFPWNKYLLDLLKADESEIYHSPSLEFENKTSKNGITISAVGEPKDFEFYIFYKRPKETKYFFGLMSSTNENYTSDLPDQTKNDVLECLIALINDDSNFLERKFN
ncbi:MAG: hypothetical protein ACPG5B_12875 [Chitinophagales bacterium]